MKRILISMVFLVALFSAFKAPACEQVEDSSYSITFASPVNLDTLGVLDWILSECGYMFPDRIKHWQSNVPPDLKVTVLTSDYGSMDILYQDINGRPLKKTRWIPSSPRFDEGILLDTIRSYNTVRFSRKIQIYGLKIRVVGYRY